MLVELAVGDAYGACFEYADEDFVATHNKLMRYVQHPTHLDLQPGCYTDDTQMTIAITELLVSGDRWTERVVADKFVQAFQRDQRKGYSRGFYELLLRVHDGQQLLAKIDPASERSGAAMRAGPIGLLPEVRDILHLADVQARVTHNTLTAVESAQAAALAVHYCHYELGPVSNVGTWINGCLKAAGGAGGWDQPWSGRVGALGRMSVRAALTAVAAGGTLSKILCDCVAFTGDVDTVATIALAAASRSPQIVNDLPSALLDGLEDGRYGRAFLANLEAKLKID